MKIARIMMNVEFIKKILQMPPTTIIHDIKFDKVLEKIEIIVEDFGLKDIEEDQEIPLVNPIISKIVWDWNQDGENGE